MQPRAKNILEKKYNEPTNSTLNKLDELSYCNISYIQCLLHKENISIVTFIPEKFATINNVIIIDNTKWIIKEIYDYLPKNKDVSMVLW